MEIPTIGSGPDGQAGADPCAARAWRSQEQGFLWKVHPDTLAKSAALARDEHEVGAVFDVIDPFARKLAQKGRLPKARKRILQHIGNALQLQHRLSGRIAAEEKPDVMWDRHDLERLYTRLEDEDELKGRADALNRKIAVIAESAKALTDLIDAQHSRRIEIAITLLIVAEVVLSLYQIWADRGH